MRRAFSIVILCSALVASTATAQSDARLTRAVEHFRNGEFAEAGTLFDEVAAEAPSNLLNLNAMAAWYKADRCEEAMAARSRVDRTQQLQPQDVEDLDRVNAYCKLKSARSFRDAGEWDKGLGLLAGLETQDEKLAAEIITLRQEIEGEKAEELEKRKLAEQETTKPEPVEPPPEPSAAERPQWALYSGIGLIGGGVVLGSVAIVKQLAFDTPAHKANLEAYAESWGCPDIESCDGYTRDASWREYERQYKFAQGANIGLGIAGGLAGAAGIALLVHHYRGSSERNSTVAPLLGPDTSGLVYSLQF